MPAPNTSPISISLSLRKGRGLVTPQAALMPFLTALNAADEAHIRPMKLAIPVIARALTMPSIVVPTNSLDTGNTSAISFYALFSVLWISPNKKTNYGNYC